MEHDRDARKVTTMQTQHAVHDLTASADGPRDTGHSLARRHYRICQALGIEVQPLPEVTPQWLQRYYEYLRPRLVFPFLASCPNETEGGGLSFTSVHIVSLLDPSASADTSRTGLLCAALREGETVPVPLVDVEVAEDGRNFTLIDDYWYWFWNWRFDPRL